MKRKEHLIPNQVNEFIDGILSSNPLDWRPNSLMTEESHRKITHNNIASAYHDYRHRLELGLKEIFREHPEAKEKITPEKLSTLLICSEAFSDEQKDLPQDLLGVSNEEMTKFYETVDKLHESKHLHEASNILLFLIALNPLISAFWQALGVIEEEKGNFKEAHISLLIAYDLEPSSFNPLFILLDFLLKERDYSLANQVVDYIEEHAPLQGNREAAQMAIEYRQRIL